MAKLGLVIFRTLEGFSKVHGVNDSLSWAKGISDIRTMLDKFSDMDDNDVPLFLSYTDNGLFLILIRPMHKRGGDNITAWIYVPSDIIISGKEMEAVVAFTRQAISGAKINTEDLDEFFAKEYQTSPARYQTSTPTNEKIAIRKYGDKTTFLLSLSNLLDTKYIHQPQYANYKYVLLADSNSSLSFPSAIEIPDGNLVESVLINPVAPVDSFTLYLNGEEFKSPIYAYKGDKFTFKWVRRDYRDIIKEVTVTENFIVPTITPNEYMKMLKYQSIRVYDSNTRRPVEDYTILVGGKELPVDGYLYVAECVYDRIEIKVSAPGYNTEVDTYDLNHQVQIPLNPKTYTYTFRFPTKDGDVLKAKVESKGLLKRTPFPGYHSLYGREPYENSVNDLVYDPFDKPYKRKNWIIRLICFVLGLVAGVFATAYVANNTIENLESRLNAAEKGHPTYVPSSQPEKTKTDPDPYTEIINYMDVNVKWNKTDLDKYPQIVGLWDALNKYDFEIVKRFKDPLKKSTKFSELISAIEQDQKKKEDYGTSFSNDLDITIDNYIKKIKTVKQSKPAPPTPEPEKKEKPTTNKWGKK